MRAAPFALIRLGLACLSHAGTAHAATQITLSAKQNHPQGNVQVSGTGFGADEQVDLYFDTTNVVDTVTNAHGRFSDQPLTVPANAQPGAHQISAVGQTSGDTSQAKFAVSTNWAEWGFDAGHTNFNPYENTLSTSTVASLAQAWFVETDPGIAEGALGNGRIFTPNGAALERVSTVSGRGRQIVTLATAISSTPAIFGNVVYVGANDNKVYALNGSTGAEIWSSPTGAASQYMYGAIVVADGMVYATSSGGNLYALDATTGNVSWQFAAQGCKLNGACQSVSDGVVYVTEGTYDSTIYALNESTGAVIWNRNTFGTISGPPIVAGGLIYYGLVDGSFHALHKKTGDFAWSRLLAQDAGGFYGGALANGVLYVASYSEGVTNYLYALNAETGDMVWTNQLSYVYGPPSVANGVVYIVASQQLQALDAATGAQLAAVRFGDNCFCTPIIANGGVYIVAAGSNGVAGYVLGADPHTVPILRPAPPPGLGARGEAPGPP